MALSEINRTATDVNVAGLRVRQLGVAYYRCLIVSCDPQRREMLALAASEGGWDTLACHDARSGLENLIRHQAQLAIVDLQDRCRDEFEELLHRMAEAAGLLLVVCGNEGDLREEVWVRQLGTWLYLPEVQDAGDLSPLCCEARLITERLHQLQRPAAGPRSRKSK